MAYNETLINLYNSTLASGYMSGSGTLSVTSASGLPSGAASYTITIIDQSTGAVTVVLRVSSRTGTTLTVAAEGSDNNANSGDFVRGGILSQISMQELLAQQNMYDILANLPATARVGADFVASDSYFDRYRWNGSVWVPFVGGAAIVAPTQSFSFVNQLSSTVTTKADGSFIFTKPTTGSGVTIYIASDVVTPPYTIDAVIAGTGNSANFTGSGVVIYDGTKFVLYGLFDNATGFGILSDKWNSVTSNAGSYTRKASNWLGGPRLWIRIVNDTSTRKFSTSFDGREYTEQGSVGATDFLTENAFGFAMENSSGSDLSVIVLGSALT